MREILTEKNLIAVKKVIVTKVFLAIAFFIFFLPLLVLPFFNHPSADDYVCGYHLKQMGFWDYQHSVYTHWGGRFASTFVGSLFVLNDYLYSHYYLHSLLLLAANFFSIYFLLKMLNTYILAHDFSRKEIVLLSFAFLALTICTYPQPSTFIFWFSSAVTYQLPVVLIQLELALFIALFNSNTTFVRTICMCLLIPLFFVLNGFNEFCLVAQLFGLAATIFLRQYRQIPNFFLVLLFLAFLSSAFIVIQSPGNQQRAAIIERKAISLAAGAVLFHVVETLWNIFKTPLFWFAVISVFVYGNKYQEKHRKLFFIQTFQKNKWLFPLITIFFLFISVAMAVAALKGGIMPDRYLNDINYCTLVLLLIYAFLLGVLSMKVLTGSFYSKYVTPVIMFSFLTIGLLCNTFIVDAFKSIIAAPLYHSIMTERETVLKEAITKQIPAVVNDYNSALQEHLQKDYANSPMTLRQWVQQKPPLLFFEDDFATGYGRDMVKNFYHLDSIIVKKD